MLGVVARRIGKLIERLLWAREVVHPDVQQHLRGQGIAPDQKAPHAVLFIGLSENTTDAQALGRERLSRPQTLHLETGLLQSGYQISSHDVTSLSACSAGVSSGWESAVGAGASFFGNEPGGVFFCVAEGTFDALPEIVPGELREGARLGVRPLRTSS